MDKQIELIDNYLTGNLNANEQTQFESQLTSNPALAEEVNFQKDVLNGIKEARTAQLKSRQNALTIPAEPLFQMWQKVAMVASTALVCGGLAFYMNTNEEVIVDKTTTEPQKEIVAVAVAVAVAPVTDTEELAPVVETMEEEIVVATSVKKTQKQQVQTSDNTSLADPLDNLPNPSVNSHKVEFDNQSNNDKEISANLKNTKTGLKVYAESKKNKFHYKYDGNNILVQIANYSDDKPAVLIDFPEKHEVFMSYKGVFYQLDKNKGWDNLSKHIITNNKLVKELQEKIK